LTTLSLMHIVAALEAREPTGRSSALHDREPALRAADRRALVLTFLVTALSPLQRIFDTVALTTPQWGLCLAAALVFLAFCELGKLFLRHTGITRPGPRARPRRRPRPEKGNDGNQVRLHRRRVEDPAEGRHGRRSPRLCEATRLHRHLRRGRRAREVPRRSARVRREPLVRELAHMHGSGFGFTASVDKVEGETLAALRDATATLASKAPDDVDAYRELVLGAADHVANAKAGSPRTRRVRSRS
jgi:hypothetical protein